MPGPGGWWFPLSRWPTLIIYWWQENRGRPSQLLLPGTLLSVPPAPTYTHTNKHRHTYSQNDSHTCMQLLESTQTLSHIQMHADIFFFPPSSPFCGVTCFCIALFYCQAWFCVALLHPLPLFLPPPLSLPASSSPSFTSCCGVTDSVTQEQTEGETEGGRGRECESSRVVCNIWEFANATTMNVLLHM